jgi:hypothetical protein
MKDFVKGYIIVVGFTILTVFTVMAITGLAVKIIDLVLF